MSKAARIKRERAEGRRSHPNVPVNIPSIEEDPERYRKWAWRMNFKPGRFRRKSLQDRSKYQGNGEPKNYS